MSAVKTPATRPARAIAGTQLYVHPGQVCVGAGAESFITILGSCVAVCLHDAALGVGGLNHFLLPQPADGTEQSPRYALGAIERLIAQLAARGARKERLAAHVVGGASVLQAFSNDTNHLGKRNVTAACETLARLRIPVVSTDVGGIRGRKLVFTPRDGTRVVELIGR